MHPQSYHFSLKKEIIRIKKEVLPESGDYFWGAIRFDLPGSVIKHCILEYGGKRSSHYGIITIIKTANQTLENVDIKNSDS